jgi:hypothetical protein
VADVEIEVEVGQRDEGLRVFVQIAWKCFSNVVLDDEGPLDAAEGFAGLVSVQHVTQMTRVATGYGEAAGTALGLTRSISLISGKPMKVLKLTMLRTEL